MSRVKHYETREIEIQCFFYRGSFPRPFISMGNRTIVTESECASARVIGAILKMWQPDWDNILFLNSPTILGVARSGGKTYP